MKKTRVLMGVMYYVLLMGLYVVAVAWIRDGAKFALEPGDKAGIVLAGLFWFALCMFVSEVHEPRNQGLRSDLFDLLLDED